MNSYLASLPSWTSFSPVRAEFRGPTGVPEVTRVTDGTDQFDRTTTPYSATSTPPTVAALGQNLEALWIGGLLQGRTYKQGIGSLEELPIRQRTPLTITINLQLADNTKTIAEPSRATVDQAIGSLVAAAEAAGHRAGSSIRFDKTEAHSRKEASLKLGLSAAFQGVDIEASLNVSRKIGENTVMAVFTQEMFTVTVVQPQTAGLWFSDAFTQELLQEQIDLDRIGPNNPPVMVSSITYGRQLVFVATSKSLTDDLKAAIQAGVEGVAKGDMELRLQNALNNSEIQMIAIGGDAASATRAIQDGKWNNYFAHDSALTTARPLYWTVRSLADNTLALVSESDDFVRTDWDKIAPPATGRAYTVKMLSVSWIDSNNYPWTNVILDAQDFSIGSEIFVRHDGGLFAYPLLSNLPYPGGSVFPRRITLRLDGTDSVRITGQVTGRRYVGGPLYWDCTTNPIVLRGALEAAVYQHTVWDSSGTIRLQFNYEVTPNEYLNN